MLPRFLLPFSLLLLTATLRASDCGCSPGEDEPIEIDVSTSGCVNGQINTTFPAPTGGGYTPTLPNPQAPGVRTVLGSNTSTLSASPNRATLKVTPGRHYSVTYSKFGSSSINSLHTRLEPRNLPAGYRVQTQLPGSTEWKDQTQIDQFGPATNVASTTHKFRVLAPPQSAGTIPLPTLSPTRFKTISNPTQNGFGFLLVEGPQTNAPAFAFPAASISIPLGSVIEDNDRIGAGSMSFRQEIAPTLGTTSPALLTYQGPAAFDAAGNSSHGLTLVRSGNNIRQIKSPEVLVDVTTVSANEFHLAVYPPGQVGTQPGTGQPYPLTGQPAVQALVIKTATLSRSPLGKTARQPIPNPTSEFTWPTMSPTSGSPTPTARKPPLLRTTSFPMQPPVRIPSSSSDIREPSTTPTSLPEAPNPCGPAPRKPPPPATASLPPNP